MTDLTKQIAELEEIEKKATPGPLRAVGGIVYALNEDHTTRRVLVVSHENRGDAELYVAMRNYLPGLITELAVAQGARDSAIEELIDTRARAEEAESRLSRALHVESATDKDAAYYHTWALEMKERAEKAEALHEEVREWGRKKHERIQELEQDLREMHIRAVDADKRAEQMQAERDVAVTVLMAHEPCPVARAPENSGHHFWKGNECVECVCEKDKREPCWREWLSHEASKRGEV